jgi:hypothetical protein
MRRAPGDRTKSSLLYPRLFNKEGVLELADLIDDPKKADRDYSTAKASTAISGKPSEMNSVH